MLFTLDANFVEKQTRIEEEDKNILHHLSTIDNTGSIIVVWTTQRSFLL